MKKSRRPSITRLLERRHQAKEANGAKTPDAAARIDSAAPEPAPTKNGSSEPPAAFAAQEAPTKPSVPSPLNLRSPADLERLRANEFDAACRAAWDDDSIELTEADLARIDVARARALAFAKDQALLDWLDEPELELATDSQGHGATRLFGVAPTPAGGGATDVAWLRPALQSSPTSAPPGEISRGGDVDAKDRDPRNGLHEPAPLVRVTGGALDADAPKQSYGPEEVFKRFLMNRSDDTLKAYKADVDAFAAWLGVSSDDAVGRLLGHGLGPANALVIEWLDSMRELAPATRKRRLSALRSVVRMARRLGAVEWSLDVDSPKAEAYRDTAGPTEHEFHKLLLACGDGLEGLRNRALVLLAVLMAFRRRELAAFRLQDFDRDRRRVFVRGKGGKNSWVGAPEEVYDALVAWLNAPKTIVGEDNDSVFLSLSPRTFGEALTRKGVYNIVTKIGERAGVRVWPHALRHAGITASLDASDGDVRMAQQFARHGDPKTTMVYDDNRTDMGGRAARLVAGKLMPKKGDGHG